MSRSLGSKPADRLARQSRSRLRGQCFETGNHAQGRRLAAAGRADEHGEFVLVHVEIDVMQHFNLAVALDEVLKNDLRHLLFRSCRIGAPAAGSIDRHPPKYCRAPHDAPHHRHTPMRLRGRGARREGALRACSESTRDEGNAEPPARQPARRRLWSTPDAARHASWTRQPRRRSDRRSPKHGPLFARGWRAVAPRPDGSSALRCSVAVS